MRGTVFVLTVCLLAFWAAGCKKKSPTVPAVADAGPGGPWQGGPGRMGSPGGPPPVEPYTGPFTAGHQVFVAQGCVRCHRGTGGGGPMGPGGPGGRGRGGPDLSEVGDKHDREWIIAHVRNAKAHNPRSRMPAYDENKISATDMKALADYLTSLKGQ
jgi:mono/diheme cytochrome c family protein